MRWRLYIFKGDKQIGDPLHIHRQVTCLPDILCDAYALRGQEAPWHRSLPLE